MHAMQCTVIRLVRHCAVWHTPLLYNRKCVMQYNYAAILAIGVVSLANETGICASKPMDCYYLAPSK